MMKNQASIATTIEPGFLRPPAAAAFLGISKRALNDLTKKGVVSGCKLSHRMMLYSRRELETAILRFQSGKVR